MERWSTEQNKTEKLRWAWEKKKIYKFIGGKLKGCRLHGESTFHLLGDS